MKKDNLNELRRSDIFSHLPQMSYLPRWGVLLLDLVLCSIAYWLSVWVGSGFFNYVRLAEQATNLGLQYCIVMGVQLLSFWAYHTYSGILRYSTFIDMIKILLSTLSAGIVLLLINLTMDYTAGYHPVLNTVVLFYMPVAFVLLFVLRVGVKTIYEVVQRSSGSPRVMIYGTQSAGVAIAKMLRSSENAPYRPVGFISDQDERSGYDLAGLRVRTLDDKLFQWMDTRRIKHVIVSPLKMKNINPSKDLQVFIDHNIHILTTPYFTQFDNVDQIDAERIGRIDSI